MENRIRIREAFLFAKSQGRKIKKRGVAGLIFPYTSEASAYTCLNNYERGHTTKMDTLQINMICRELKVDANFLFGTPPMSNINTKEDEHRESTGPSEAGE